MKRWAACVLFLASALSFVGGGSEASAACTGASPTWTVTLNAGVISQTDLQTCLNNALDNDTINVVAGSGTFTSGSIAAQNSTAKCINLVGAGIGQTIINDAATENAIRITVKDGCLTTISGFTFQGGSSPNNNHGILRLECRSTYAGINTGVRIHHVSFLPNNQAALWVGGWIHGVYDHNTCVSKTNVFCMYVMNGEDDPNRYGDTSWELATDAGTLNMWVIEDSSFSSADAAANDWILDGWLGARHAFRFNAITNTMGITNHGFATPGRYGAMRHYEAYNNTMVITDGEGRNGAFQSSSGTELVFNNVLTGAGWTNSRIGDMQVYRSHTSEGVWGISGNKSVSSITHSASTATVTVPSGHQINVALPTWTGDVKINGATGGDASCYNIVVNNPVILSSTQFQYTTACPPVSDATGTLYISNPWDGNQDAFGYPSLGQSGQGIRSVIMDATSKSSQNPTPPTNGVGSALEPVYSFNNTINGTLAGLQPTPASSANLLVENRDYYNQSNSFDCGTVHGVGRGPRSSRPACTTSGDAWWATDDNGSFWNNGQANSGCLDIVQSGVWVNCAYTPATYPHPLQGLGNQPSKFRGASGGFRHSGKVTMQ
jgi:hypothetical protein